MSPKLMRPVDNHGLGLQEADSSGPNDGVRLIYTYEWQNESNFVHVPPHNKTNMFWILTRYNISAELNNNKSIRTLIHAET
jgi:hypothetical protein